MRGFISVEILKVKRSNYSLKDAQSLFIRYHWLEIIDLYLKVVSEVILEVFWTTNVETLHG